MAYAALILFKQSLEEIHNPHQKIQSLKEKVCYLLDFLENPSQNCNLAISVDLERKMRYAACEGEYIIESHFLKLTTSFRKRLYAGIRDLIPVSQKNSLQERLQEFDHILDECVSNIKDEKVNEPLQLVRNTFAAGPSRISSGKRSAMVGFDGDFMQIKDQLTGSSSRLEIISIVGMGGIGKTTLATNLYNDSLINYHFDVRAWTTVSLDYQRKEILRDLLRNFSSESHQMSIDQLEEYVYKSLTGRRYLIVMDDVWETKVWDDVKRFFPDDDNNGSRIILTTRMSDVALYANPDQDSIHHVNLLSSEDSWNLLRGKVYGEEISYPSEFEEIGKKIAWNCKGLPLAIVVIGGLLSKGSRTLDYWEYIERNVMRAVTGTDDQLMEILSLSYNNLPHHLKACFLYIGAFPEDEEILVSRLIKLWVAEGFLKPHYSKNLEEMAREYLKDLIDRNLVMVGKRVRLDDEIKTCTIHDLLRDLCMQKAREEKFLLVLNRASPFLIEAEQYEYRFSSQSNFLDIDKYDFQLLRTFLYFTKSFYTVNIFESVKRFRLLRVIDALAIKFHKFPIQIVELINLRYLALSTFGLHSKFEIPAAIVKLKNLQTFILNQIDRSDREPFRHPPLEIWGMPQLRHLSFKSRVFSLFSVDSRLDRVMLQLHTLSGIENMICSKEVFQMLPNLKKLRISYLWDRFTERSSCDFNSFVWLNKLETLNLSFDSNRHWDSIPMNFGFPMKLKKLTLRHCRLPWNNMETIGSLPNLQVLKLKENAFVGPTWEPNEGEFLVLKYLLLENMDLIEWKANEAHFPVLQHLSLSECNILKEIPSAIGDIPTLQMLELKLCNSSVTESAKLIVEEQRSLGNDNLELHL